MTALEKYLSHLNLKRADLAVNMDSLERIITAHLDAFHYQNTMLFIEGKKSIADRQIPFLSEHLLLEQFIDKRQSGYCFQINYLLAWALNKLGFTVKQHLAVSIFRPVDQVKNETFTPTHMVLIVRLNNQDWFVDAGFANNSFRAPLLLQGGEYQIQENRYELHNNVSHWRLDLLDPEKICFMLFQKQASTFKEITTAHEALYLSQEGVRIRDDILKLAVVSGKERRDLSFIWSTKHCYFKSSSADRKTKGKEINSRDELRVIALKKFGFYLPQELDQLLPQRFVCSNS